MRLAIADPPYLGRAGWYGGTKSPGGDVKYLADRHPDADRWDDPAEHIELVDRLGSYDGWAIAGAPDSLPVYLARLDAEVRSRAVRVMAWCRPDAAPSGGPVIPSWEFVLAMVPAERRTHRPVRDYLVVPKAGAAFAGAKPRAWTRWVLDVLGYDASTDTVDDLFPGSGAVAAEVAQGVLL